MALNRNNLKQTPIPVVPRRMQLVNPDGTPTRSGQLLLEQTLQASVTYGAAGGMAGATGLQDGAFYVVQDMGEVLYQLQGGEWHYIAGTMWGTLSPDGRPVGLGANDAGFTFRTIDSDPRYGARTFVWSGSVWVETTAARFDTHANRLAGSIENENGMLWVETDRSEVLYQLQGSGWHFIAGTMWGTLSPDQRPTDLGVNDAGFDYRGTDQQREFIWSGTAWVETTGVGGATNLTHANVVTKVSASGQITEGTINDQGAATAIWILSSGHVAINTSSPDSFNMLQVNGIFAVSAGSGVWLTAVRACGMTDSSNGITFRTGNVDGQMVLDSAGHLKITNLPSTNPGAGTKQLWYDPADGNRVKFAP